jgi:mycofactocin precursor
MTSTVAETTATPAVDPADPVVADDEVLAELLIEEISIDGMCGVY